MFFDLNAVVEVNHFIIIFIFCQTEMNNQQVQDFNPNYILSQNQPNLQDKTTESQDKVDQYLKSSSYIQKSDKDKISFLEKKLRAEELLKQQLHKNQASKQKDIEKLKLLLNQSKVQIQNLTQKLENEDNENERLMGLVNLKSKDILAKATQIDNLQELLSKKSKQLKLRNSQFKKKVEELKVKSKQLEQNQHIINQKNQEISQFKKMETRIKFQKAKIAKFYQDQFKDNSKMSSLKKVGIMGKNIENNSKAQGKEKIQMNEGSEIKEQNLINFKDYLQTKSDE